MKTKVIKQSGLTSDCWLVQFWGISACQDCPMRGTDECGGKNILRKIEAGTFPVGGLKDEREK